MSPSPSCFPPLRCSLRAVCHEPEPPGARVNDPHVATLSYQIVTDEGLAFNAPPALRWQTAGFDVHLDEGMATFTMHDHYASQDDARCAVEPFIAAWEIQAAISWGLRGRELRFVYQGASVIDRSPDRDGIYGTVSAERRILWRVEANAVVSKPAYPDPPSEFVASPDVETMWNRFERYLQGREPLASMAYFCLTLLEQRAGGGRGKRREASRRYCVDFDVLNTLGELVSARGDASNARKADGWPLTPLTVAEQAWVEAVIKKLILRVGEPAHDPTRPWPQITMHDFP